MSDLRQNILDTVDDLVANFLYYDRKEDQDLPRGAIDRAIRDGVITADDIVQHFSEVLKKNLSED